LVSVLGCRESAPFALQPVLGAERVIGVCRLCPSLPDCLRVLPGPSALFETRSRAVVEQLSGRVPDDEQTTRRQRGGSGYLTWLRSLPWDEPAFALTVMAVSYWLGPQITGKRLQIAIGGTLLFVALAMFLVVMVGTWLARPGAATLSVSSHIPAPLSGTAGSPRVLDNRKIWTAIAAVLILLAYGFPLWALVSDGLLSPGMPPIPV